MNKNCTCNPGYAGSSCQFSRTDCRGNGIPSTDNNDSIVCVCDKTYSTSQGKDVVYKGKYCQYKDNDTCSGHGIVDDNGNCACNTGYAGSSCQYSNAANCNNGGNVDVNGNCTCNVGYAGSSCQYSNAANCNNRGTVDANGNCTCSTCCDPSTLIAGKCKRYNGPANKCEGDCEKEKGLNFVYDTSKGECVYQQPPGVPGKPTSIIVKYDNFLGFSITVQVDANGSPITGYSYQKDGGPYITINTSSNSFFVPQIEDKKWHTFNVKAVNAIGTGLPSSASGSAQRPYMGPVQ